MDNYGIFIKRTTCFWQLVVVVVVVEMGLWLPQTA
jgi:hypothetical protein